MDMKMNLHLSTYEVGEAIREYVAKNVPQAKGRLIAVKVFTDGTADATVSDANAGGGGRD